MFENLPNCCDGVPERLIRCKHDLYQCDCCNRAKSTNSTGNESEPPKATMPGERFQMDFGFIKGEETLDNNTKKIFRKVIKSYDGYSSYLIIADKKTRMLWVFLSKSKVPPLQTVKKFLEKHGIPKDKQTGLNCVIRIDRGGGAIWL